MATQWIVLRVPPASVRDTARVAEQRPLVSALHPRASTEDGGAARTLAPDDLLRLRLLPIKAARDLVSGVRGCSALRFELLLSLSLLAEVLGLERPPPLPGPSPRPSPCPLPSPSPCPSSRAKAPFVHPWED